MLQARPRWLRVDIRLPGGRQSVHSWVVAGLVVALATAMAAMYVPGYWRYGDVQLYHIYALGFWGGLAHPLLPSEYPPLSILLMSVTLAGPPQWYADLFACSMGAITVLGYVAFRRWTSPGQANAYLLYALAAGVATLLFRFDIVPALLTVGALWLTQRRHFSWAYALLAVATLTKLFPVVMLPIVAVAQVRAHEGNGGVRRALSSVALCVSLILAGFLLAHFIDPRHWLGALTFDLRRPDEMESIPAAMMWLASFAGLQVTPQAGFGSFNLVSGVATYINAALGLALVVGLAWIYWRQLRGRITTGQAALGVLLLLLCTSKVLSAQYILWLAPLVATTLGLRPQWFLLFLLTALVFPTLFGLGITTDARGLHLTYSPIVLGAVVARDALLLGLTASFLTSPGVDVEEARLRARRPAMRHAREPAGSPSSPSRSLTTRSTPRSPTTSQRSGCRRAPRKL